jgi:ADP-ribose pyrophosphatase YjhB (NUDIX family)
MQYKNSKPTVNAIVIDDKNRVLLAKRDAEIKSGLWDCPGGYLENGEHPFDGLKRETKEEVEIEIEPEEFLCFTIEDDLWENDGETKDLAISFRCKVISGEPKPGDETSEVKWFKKDEIPWDQIAFPGVVEALKIHYKTK